MILYILTKDRMRRTRNYILSILSISLLSKNYLGVRDLKSVTSKKTEKVYFLKEVIVFFIPSQLVFVIIWNAMRIWNVIIYVDNLWCHENPRALEITTNYLIKIFEMKYLWKTNFCLWLQIKHSKDEIFVSSVKLYRKNFQLYMDKARPQSSPMIFRG